MRNTDFVVNDDSDDDNVFAGATGPQEDDCMERKEMAAGNLKKAVSVVDVRIQETLCSLTNAVRSATSLIESNLYNLVCCEIKMVLLFVNWLYMLL